MSEFTEIAALRELIETKIGGLRKEIEALAMLSEEKFKAQAILWKATDKASQTAVDKSDRAQELRNVVANEWRASLDDANRRNISKVDADNQFSSLNSKIDAERQERVRGAEELTKQVDALRDSQNLGAGRQSSDKQSRFQRNWSTGTWVPIAVSIAALALTLWFAVNHPAAKLP